MKFFILFSSVVLLSFSVQGQEDLYIKFNPENGDVCKGDDVEIWFHIQPKIDASFFIYNKDIVEKKQIYKKQISRKLISKERANKRVKEIMQKRAEQYEKETGESWQAITNPPYPFDALFKNIYVFITDSTGERGFLYPVSWRYAIE